MDSDGDETRQCHCLYGKTSESLFKSKGNYLKLHINSAVIRTELKVEKISEKLENWFTQPYENFVSEVIKGQFQRFKPTTGMAGVF